MKFTLAIVLLSLDISAAANNLRVSSTRQLVPEDGPGTLAWKNEKIATCMSQHDPEDYGQCIAGDGERRLQELYVSSASSFGGACAPLPVDPVSDGWTELIGNDDGSVETDLGFTFSHYGIPRTMVWINNNGNLSFEDKVTAFTSSGFPVNGSPMIAPFWADVDTSGPGYHGKVWYKPLSAHSFSVIWDGVGYYPQRIDKRNTFQVVISDGTDATLNGDVGNNVCFCYGKMEWTTGSASGGFAGVDGTPATVGINKGFDGQYVQIGRFSKTGTAYDGPGGDHDGVNWLDFKGQYIEDTIQEQAICFDARGVNNVFPVITGFPTGEVLAATCGTQIILDFEFATPEIDQNITVVLPDSGSWPVGLTLEKTRSASGDHVSVSLRWSPASYQQGTYVLEFKATDSFIPPASTEKTLTIVVLAGMCDGRSSVEPDEPNRCVAIPDNENTCEQNPKPNCTPHRSPDHCPAEQSFPLLIRTREEKVKTYLQNIESNVTNNLDGNWFQFLEDKGVASAFTRSHNIPAPQIYCCVDAINDLGDCFNATSTSAPPTSFVIRASGLHSTMGIYVMPSGFQGVELISNLNKTLEDILTELVAMVPSPTKIIVEEFIAGSGSGATATLPAEYKFHVFNGTVGSVSVFYNRGTDCGCYLEVDEYWNRHDKHGCFVPSMPMGANLDNDMCYDIDFDAGALNPYQLKGFDFCGPVPKPADCVWNALLEYAKTLSMAIGVYMRIDAFVTEDGRIYVQEYTRNHAGGLRHCAARTKEDGCVDSCFLGEMWDSADAGGQGMYGGPLTVAPAFLNGFSLVGGDQCSVIANGEGESSQMCASVIRARG